MSHISWCSEGIDLWTAAGVETQTDAQKRRGVPKAQSIVAGQGTEGEEEGGLYGV